MSLTKAQIAVGHPDQATPFDVHFNPASLRITTTNTLSDGNPNEASKPTAYKLDVELLFDSTETGQDIYEVTKPLRWAAIATARGGTAQPSSGSEEETPRDLSLISFMWGTARYFGYIESLNETIDYWSSDGTPLRSTIQVSIKGFTETFVHGSYSAVENYLEDNALPPALDMVTMTDALDSDRVFTAASQAGGERSTGRGLAALNGAENMRTGAGAFASAGAFAGAGGAGAFAGASASAGAGAFAGAGASAGASASAGAGVAASAGVSLQAAAGFKLAGGVSAGASAGFGIGASAGLSASAGLGASVGIGMAGGAGIGIGAGAGLDIGGGIGISAGAGIGAGAGISMGASAGIGASASFGAEAGVSALAGFGGASAPASFSTGSASAGVSASAGAFAGLGTSSGTHMPSADFNANRLLPRPFVPTANASFDLSGRAIGGGAVAESWSYSETTSW